MAARPARTRCRRRRRHRATRALSDRRRAASAQPSTSPRGPWRMKTTAPSQLTPRAGTRSRHTEAIRIDLAKALLQNRPIDRLRQRYQFVLHVEDLVEPGTERILLSGLALVTWSGQLPSPDSPPPKPVNHVSTHKGIAVKYRKSCNHRSPENANQTARSIACGLFTSDDRISDVRREPVRNPRRRGHRCLPRRPTRSL